MGSTSPVVYDDIVFVETRVVPSSVHKCQAFVADVLGEADSGKRRRVPVSLDVESPHSVSAGTSSSFHVRRGPRRSSVQLRFDRRIVTMFS